MRFAGAITSCVKPVDLHSESHEASRKAMSNPNGWSKKYVTVLVRAAHWMTYWSGPHI